MTNAMYVRLGVGVVCGRVGGGVGLFGWMGTRGGGCFFLHRSTDLPVQNDAPQQAERLLAVAVDNVLWGQQPGADLAERNAVARERCHDRADVGHTMRTRRGWEPNLLCRREALPPRPSSAPQPSAHGPRVRAKGAPYRHERLVLGEMSHEARQARPVAQVHRDVGDSIVELGQSGSHHKTHVSQHCACQPYQPARQSYLVKGGLDPLDGKAHVGQVAHEVAFALEVALRKHRQQLARALPLRRLRGRGCRGREGGGSAAACARPTGPPSAPC